MDWQPSLDHTPILYLSCPFSTWHEKPHTMTTIFHSGGDSLGTSGSGTSEESQDAGTRDDTQLSSPLEFVELTEK